jgi:hypothetical protein
MRYLSYAICALAALMLFLPAVADSAAQGSTFKAVFTGEFSFPEQAAAKKPGANKNALPSTQAKLPKIPAAGEILWAEPNLRVDVTNGLNQEAMRLLVNFDTGKAAMLYPDTLNGYRTDLAALDKKGYLPVVRDFLAQPNTESTPKGFTKKTAGAEKLNGVSANHTKFVKDDGTQVDVWRKKNGDPVRIAAKTSKGKLVLDFTSFKRGVKVDSKSFAIDKSFEMQDMKDPPSELGKS